MANTNVSTDLLSGRRLDLQPRHRHPILRRFAGVHLLSRRTHDSWILVQTERTRETGLHFPRHLGRGVDVQRLLAGGRLQGHERLARPARVEVAVHHGRRYQPTHCLCGLLPYPGLA